MDYKQREDGLTEHITSHATMQTSHCKAASNIISDKKDNIWTAWPKWLGISWKSSTLKHYSTSHHLSTQNQFIGNEDMSSWWPTMPCTHLIFSRGGFAAGFITTSDLISFSYASKSQVRQTFGMIQGEWPTHWDWTPGINLGKSSMLTCLVVT